MGDTTKHVLVGIDYGGGFVAEIDPASVKLTPAIADAIQRAGAIHPLIKLALASEPVIEFTTNDIKLLSAPTALSVGSPLKLYFRALTDTFGFGTGYISVACSAGLAVPTTLSGGRGRVATLGVAVHLLSSDGDAAPFTVGTSSPTLAIPTDYYCLGAVTLTSELEGVTEASFDFGFRVAKNTGEAGKPYPTKAWVPEQDAKLTATVEGIAAASQARLAVGTAETTATVAWRKVTATAFPVNSGGYLITGQKAAVRVSTLSGGRPSTAQVIADFIATAFDGTGYLQFTTPT